MQKLKGCKGPSYQPIRFIARNTRTKNKLAQGLELMAPKAATKKGNGEFRSEKYI